MRVFLEKVKHEELNARFNCFDMHVHTKYSDSYTRTKNIVKKAEKLGINFAITDHNEIRGVSDALRSKSSRVVVPGIEVGCREGPHLLFYFHDYPSLKEFYLKNVYRYKVENPFMCIDRSADDILDSAEDYDCMVSAAHPAAPPVLGLARAVKKGYIDAKILDRVPAVEVISGMVTEKMNLRAIKLGYELKKGFTGGSDAHTLTHFGSVLTCSEAEDIDSLFRDILAHKTHVYGRHARAGTRILPHAKTVSKHMRYGRSTIRLRTKSMIAKPLKHNVGRFRKRISDKKRSSHKKR